MVGHQQRLMAGGSITEAAGRTSKELAAAPASNTPPLDGRRHETVLPCCRKSSG